MHPTLQNCNIVCMYNVVLSGGGGGVGAWNAAAAACSGKIMLQVTMVVAVIITMIVMMTTIVAATRLLPAAHDKACVLPHELSVLPQLSDDWEPAQGWDEDMLRALRVRGIELDDEWVLQVTCDV